LLLRMLTFTQLFNCKSCGHWYLRDEEGPLGDCKRCYWGVPIDPDVVCPQEMIAVMLAREVENLLAA
jgi:hypothetical protein